MEPHVLPITKSGLSGPTSTLRSLEKQGPSPPVQASNTALLGAQFFSKCEEHGDMIQRPMGSFSQTFPGHRWMRRLGMLGLEQAHVLPDLAGTHVPWLVHTKPGSASKHSLFHSPDSPRVANRALTPCFRPASGGCGHFGLISISPHLCLLVCMACSLCAHLCPNIPFLEGNQSHPASHLD